MRARKEGVRAEKRRQDEAKRTPVTSIYLMFLRHNCLREESGGAWMRLCPQTGTVRRGEWTEVRKYESTRVRRNHFRTFVLSYCRYASAAVPSASRGLASTPSASSRSRAWRAHRRVSGMTISRSNS